MKELFKRLFGDINKSLKTVIIYSIIIFVIAVVLVFAKTESAEEIISFLVYIDMFFAGILGLHLLVKALNFFAKRDKNGYSTGEKTGSIGKLVFWGLGLVFLFMGEGLTFVALFVIGAFWGKFFRLLFNTNNSKEPFDINELASYLNPKELIKGYRWSNYTNILNKLYKKDKNYIFIDEFRLSDESKNKFLEYSSNLPEEVKNTKAYFHKLDFTKVILTIGEMGSGKTAFFMSILAQNRDSDFSFFNREVIHDVKGDFTQKFYNEETDYIFNPYDERGVYWDIWHEMNVSEVVVLSFIKNLIESFLKDGDFFSNSANQKITQFFLMSHFSDTDATNIQKWDKFIKYVEEYRESIGDDKTQSSVYANLELVLDVLKLFAWQSSQKEIKKFTISQFLEEEKTRLILLNNSNYSRKLYPVFTGFLSMFTEMMASLPDTDEDNLTLLLFDEYLSMKFDDRVREVLHREIRSKGGCLTLGIQYIDMSSVKTKQLINSSKYATFIFSTGETDTMKDFISNYGDIQYEKRKVSKNKTKNDAIGGDSSGTTTSVEDKTENFITSKHLQSMPKYHHLTLMPKENILYLGYTPEIKLDIKNKSFIKKDMKDYYKFMYFNNKSELATVKDNDIYTFAQKRRIYLEFTKLDKDKEDFNDRLDDLIKNYELENVDLDNFFKEVM